MKAWIYIGIIAAVCTGIGTGFKLHGDSRWREGYAAAIQLKTNTDLQHLTERATQQQDINQQVQNGLIGLNAYKDAPVDPSIASSLKWVRDTRKPHRD